MPKSKPHSWKEVEGIKGVHKCTNCGMIRYTISAPNNRHTFYARGKHVDRTATRHNCFTLSKV